jgi:NADP-dependent 3-hydroxy acid dehydrogenase YdfG
LRLVLPVTAVTAITKICPYPPPNPLYAQGENKLVGVATNNVLGLLYATDAAIAVMKEQQSGHIVNISSVAGRKTGPLRGAYSGTKFAVNAISEALRQELQEDNIRITMIEPGAVATELTNHITDEEAKEGVSGMIAAMEPLQSEDIANAQSPTS